MSSLYVDGIGESTGDSLVTDAPLYLSGSTNVWFVSSVSGTDAASPQGLDKGSPLATLGQAYTNASAGDWIVLLADHAETRTSALSLAKANMTIVAAGSSAGIPTVTLTNNSSAQSLLTISAANVEIRNIKFPQQSQENSSAIITVSAANFTLGDCYMEAGQYNDGALMTVGSQGHNLRVDGSTFISVATSAAQNSRPDCAIRITGGSINYPLFDGMVLSNGLYGWFNSDGNNAAFVDVSGMVGARFKRISQLLGADIYMDSGSSVNYLTWGTKTGGAKVRLSS